MMLSLASKNHPAESIWGLFLELAKRLNMVKRRCADQARGPFRLDAVEKIDVFD
jgi:hypothetical protein